MAVTFCGSVRDFIAHPLNTKLPSVVKARDRMSEAGPVEAESRSGSESSDESNAKIGRIRWLSKA